VSGAYLYELGVTPYQDALEVMTELAGARSQGAIPDTVMLLEHDPVITLGSRAVRGEELLLAAVEYTRRGIEVVEVSRGGRSTYHGPGQLVCYPIFLLREGERDLHVYLRNLEEAIIRACARFGLAGERKSGWTGVWTAGGARKLASIGVAVKRWVTMHGFALNVSTDLARFAAINPCGLDAAVMGSMSGELARPLAVAAVKDAVRDAFAEVFDRRFAPAR
jgi:lipoate-protein ligase B